MSQEKVEIVRKPLRVRENSSRTLDQRLAIRFPQLNRATLRLLSKLPPSSRVRQALLWRAMQLAIEAYNRGDLAAVATGFHPELKYYPYRQFVEAGLAEACYNGPAGYRAYITATYDVWGTEVRLYPTELIDMGDRIVLLADMPMRAQGSGVPLAETYAMIATIEEGGIVSQRDFLNQAEALEAVALSE